MKKPLLSEYEKPGDLRPAHRRLGLDPAGDKREETGGVARRGLMNRHWVCFRLAKGNASPRRWIKVIFHYADKDIDRN